MHDKSSGAVRCVQFLHWFLMTMFMEFLDNKSNERREAHVLGVMPRGYAQGQGSSENQARAELASGEKKCFFVSGRFGNLF